MATPTSETKAETITSESSEGNACKDGVESMNTSNNGTMNGTTKHEEAYNEQQQPSTDKNSNSLTSTKSVKETNSENPDPLPQSPKEEPKKSIPQNKQSSLSVSNTSSDDTTPLPTDPNAVRFKFIFANHDGLNVLVDCKLTDTVGEVKGALLSVWPEGLPDISESDRIRLICMGRGFLMPDSRNLKECQVPIFKTYATPINVSIKPESSGAYGSSPDKSKNKDGSSSNNGNNGSGRNNGSVGNGSGARQGCACVIS